LGGGGGARALPQPPLATGLTLSKPILIECDNGNYSRFCFKAIQLQTTLQTAQMLTNSFQHKQNWFWQSRRIL